MPPDITKLVNLQSFNFRSNKIEAVPALDALPSLFILDLSHNQIKTFPKSLKRMTTLRYVSFFFHLFLHFLTIFLS